MVFGIIFIFFVKICLFLPFCRVLEFIDGIFDLLVRSHIKNPAEIFFDTTVSALENKVICQKLSTKNAPDNGALIFICSLLLFAASPAL